ncbi:MAG: CheR family methyltransferase [Methylocystis sp.]|uniref:CheR family methyltransferase n=1 Tax=Methylocystis sp. TaxID=1911079 RepID=UPI003DA29ADF
MHFGDADLEVMGQRLGRVLDQFGLGTLERLADEIERGKRDDVTAAVVHAASTNHTYFFREMDTLNVFRDRILPGLASQPEIRIWSAAASTGDEAYTCAMLSAETMDLSVASERIKILGTDISGPVIQLAEAGAYRPSSLENVPFHIKSRYFKPTADGRFAIVDDIKRMCTFRRMNLKSRPYPFQKRFDIVLCRNVLYYFRPATQREVLELIYEVTQPNGWLLTDVSFTLRDLGVSWVTVASGVHRKPA